MLVLGCVEETEGAGASEEGGALGGGEVQKDEYIRIGNEWGGGDGRREGRRGSDGVGEGQRLGCALDFVEDTNVVF